MLRKKRILTALIFTGIFIATYYIGAESTISPQDAKSFVKEFNQAVTGIDAIGIFTHNASVALPMFIPGFGVAWGSFAALSTGLAFKALVESNPILSRIPPISLLIASPFGVLELAAYSIGMSRGYLLIWRIIKKNPLKQELRPTLIEIGIVIGLLLVAGFIEFAMISKVGSHIHLSKP